MAEVNYVHYHDCVALGPNVKLPRALMADPQGEYILYYQHKCPFCSTVSGERELAKGVTENTDGSFSVDTRIAEKLHGE